VRHDDGVVEGAVDGDAAPEAQDGNQVYGSEGHDVTQPTHNVLHDGDGGGWRGQVPAVEQAVPDEGARDDAYEIREGQLEEHQGCEVVYPVL